MRVLLATSNPGKIAELSRELASLGFDAIGLDAIAKLDLVDGETLETGSTFSENALLKARYYHRESRIVTIADDSGLEVDALEGKPGIFSARYAGPGATDAQRTARLLVEMESVPADRRGARFVS